MRCWVLPGSVQLQDYYIHPEKMGASRKDLADAIQSYSDNDSQKNGELFSSHYRSFPQTHADVLKHLWLPIQLSNGLYNGGERIFTTLCPEDGSPEIGRPQGTPQQAFRT